MDTSRLIRVNYFPHLFKGAERVIKDVTPKTFKEIIEEMEISINIGSLRVFDEDKIVTDLNTIPKSDFVIIKSVPTGSDVSTETAGYGSKAIGWLSIIGGTAAVVFGQTWGLALIGSGLSMALSGASLLLTDAYNTDSTTDAESALSISGGSNREPTYNRVPILLGRYLTYPDKCALDYTSETDSVYLSDTSALPTKYVVSAYGDFSKNIFTNVSTAKIKLDEDKTTTDYVLCNRPTSGGITYRVKVYKDKFFDTKVATLYYGDSAYIDSDWNITTYDGEGDLYPTYTHTSTVYENQQLHQLFNFGYSDITVDEDTLKIGDTLVSTYNEDTEYIDYTIQKGDELCPSQYKTIVKQTSVASIAYYDDPVIFETSSSIQSMELVLLFTNGLYQMPDTTAKNLSISISVYYKISDSEDDYTEITTETISGNSQDGFRYVISTYFDEAETYTIKVVRNTVDDDDDDVEDDNRQSTFYVESARCYNSIADTPPIVEETKVKLTTLGWAITASTNLNSSIDDFNAECDLRVRDWNGLGSGSDYWEVVETGAVNNPAALVIYILTSEFMTNHPKDDTEIDWETFEDWWTFCDDNGFTCNNYLKEDSLRADTIIEYICICGMASFNYVDGLFTVIIDTTRDRKQYFSPRNSWGYSGTKTFPDVPTAYSMSFVNEDNEYIQEEYVVYYDDDDEDDTTITEYTAWGITNSTHIYKMAKYFMACTTFRSMTHTFSADIENIVCTRGDRIGFAHDVIQAGIKWGRVKSLITEDETTTGVVLDEYVVLEEGYDYGIVFRLDDGTEESAAISFSEEQETNTLYFTEAISTTDVIAVGDLAFFGYFENEYIDLIITDMVYNEDFSATITAVDYAPEVFEAITGDIPEFSPSVIPSSSSLGTTLIGYDGVDIETAISSLTTAVGIADNTSTVLTGITTPVYNNNTDGSDDGIQSGKMAFTGDTDYVYVNYDVGNELYLKTTKTVTDGTSITSGIVADCPVYLNDDIMVYVNQSQGSTLYYKNYDEDSEGTQFTSVVSWRPRLISSNNVLYINFEDENKIYITYIYESGNGTLYADISVKDFCFLQNGYLAYIPIGGQGIYTYNTSTKESVQISADEVISLATYDFDTVAYLDVSETRIYTRDCFDDSIETGKPLIDNAIDFATQDSSIIYSSSDDNSNIYADLSDSLQTLDWLVEPTLDYFSITADITEDSYVMVVSDVDNLGDIVRGDLLSGTGLQDDTYIDKISGSNVYLTKTATLTLTTTTVVVQGTRLLIPANKVIIEGSIEAEQMSTSAIDSKAYTDELTKITEIDLDNGTYIFRKQDGTVVLDFDASRTDSEFILSGTLDGADGTFSGSLSGATGTFSGSITVEDIYSRVTIEDGYIKLESLEGSLANTMVFTNAYNGNLICSSEISTTLTSSAYYNTAIGYDSFINVTSGNYNTTFGYASLKAITEALRNSAFGSNALLNITTGDDNSAFGSSTLKYNISGSDNCAFGSSALYWNTGSRNTAFGTIALQRNSSGVDNTAIGTNSCKGHNTNYRITGSGNTAVGSESLYDLYTGSYNIGIGYEAMYGDSSGISGSYNVGMGYHAMYDLSSGYGNTAVGNSALANVTTVYNNTAIGNTALGNLITYNNCSGLGYNAQVTGSNQIQLGNSSTTTYAYGAVQDRSDERDKADIVDNELGLIFINSLRPVQFKWNYREDYYEYTEEEYIEIVDDVEVTRTKTTRVELENDGSKTRNRKHNGFIAQEVKEVMDTLGIDFAGYQDASINGGEDVLSLGYEEFISPMVKAIQELNSKVETQQETIDAMLLRLEVLEN